MRGGGQTDIIIRILYFITRKIHSLSVIPQIVTAVFLLKDDDNNRAYKSLFNGESKGLFVKRVIALALLSLRFLALLGFLCFAKIRNWQKEKESEATLPVSGQLPKQYTPLHEISQKRKKNVFYICIASKHAYICPT